jgi:protein SCO1/2
MMRATAAWLGACLIAATGAANAQPGLPAPLREVGIDQRLNQRIPMKLLFRDEDGRLVQIGDLFKGKPVVLALVYYQCPMLCTMVLNGTLRAVRTLSLDAGTDFEIVAVSFDPSEAPALAAAKKAEYVRRYERKNGEAGWHFLTGDQAAIRQLTDTAGFRYKYDPSTKQFAHASAIIVVSPDGRISRYLYGIEYSARDLRLSIVEASQGKVGSPVDQALLYCFHYDPATGKYGFVIMNVIRVLGAATVACLATFLWIMFRRDRNKRLRHRDGLPVIS